MPMRLTFYLNFSCINSDWPNSHANAHFQRNEYSVEGRSSDISVIHSDYGGTWKFPSSINNWPSSRYLEWRLSGFGFDQGKLLNYACGHFWLGISAFLLLIKKLVLNFIDTYSELQWLRCNKTCYCMNDVRSHVKMLCPFGSSKMKMIVTKQHNLWLFLVFLVVLGHFCYDKTGLIDNWKNR